MKKTFWKITPYIKYFLVFFFFLFWNLIVQPVNLDEIWNYGFAHNISSGLIPYKDFNMVITPLFPFIMAFPLKLFGSSMLIFHIEWSLILTLIFSILYNKLQEKSYFFLILMVFPLSIAFPSYNMFLLFLFLIILKLEDNSANDYLIGFILACIFFTKQTVGVVMLLPTLYYFKSLSKIKKRMISLLITIVIFILYLLITSSLSEFIDLCFLGLFDFATTNSKGINIFLILSLVLLGVSLFFIKKDKNNLKNYYLLSFFSILLPLFDMYHFEIFFFAFLFILLEQKELNLPLNRRLFTTGVILGLSIISIYYRNDSKFTYPNDIKHFSYRYLTSDYMNFSNKINNLIAKYKDREIIFLSADGYYFRIINDMAIGYLDLINTGNWGYSGTSKLLNTIKHKKNCIFFVDTNELGGNKQTDQEALKYVINNGSFLEKEGSYYIYEIK